VGLFYGPDNQTRPHHSPTKIFCYSEHMYKPFRSLQVFVDRYPMLGPAIWMLVVQYLVVQVIAASFWKPPYSWRFNTISDLGNTACGAFGNRLVCSPLHVSMNISFIALGVLMISGSLLIYHEFHKNIGTFVGFSLMALGGVGTVLVGVFPENTSSGMHSLGAALALLVGNLSLVVLSIALYKVSIGMRLYTGISGGVALVAFSLFVSHHYWWLGIGGVERFISYPQALWLIAFGVYMSHDRFCSSWTYLKKLVS